MNTIPTLKSLNIIGNGKYPNRVNLSILNKHPTLVEYIHKHTSFLNYEASLKVRVHCVYHNITSQPKCRHCDNLLEMRTTTWDFATYCSKDCISSCDKVKEKRVETTMERHGTDNMFRLETTKTKSATSMMIKYGTTIPMHSKEIKSKMKKTMLDRYGVENINMVPKFRNKAKNTMLDRYGVEYSLQSDELQTKMKNTMLERHGVDNASKSPIIRSKVIATNTERYGFSCSSKSPAVKDKAIAGNNNKFGVDYTGQRHLPKDAILLGQDKDWLIEQHHAQHRSITEIAISIGYSPTALQRIFKRHNIRIIRHPHSNGEMDMLDFINTNTQTDVIQGDRELLQGFELDIYIPSMALAIEYNGVYWHRETHTRDSLYHLSKTSKCNDHGITLLQFWDLEWIYKRPQVEQTILKHILPTNTDDNTIVHPTTEQIHHFIATTQPHTKFSYSSSLGLEVDGVLCCVMLFNQINNGVHDMWVGVSSPFPNPRILLDLYSNTHPVNIVCVVADIRLGEWDMYEQLGFTEVMVESPKCKYFSNGSTSLTTKQNTQKDHRLWDCGVVHGILTYAT